uniref:Uncharacterized protein n=1 Tax=Caenorhabditis japonica TaxID=281687 RepID=A0A8R1EVA6_CAEJA
MSLPAKCLVQVAANSGLRAVSVRHSSQAPK